MSDQVIGFHGDRLYLQNGVVDPNPKLLVSDPDPGRR